MIAMAAACQVGSWQSGHGHALGRARVCIEARVDVPYRIFITFATFNS